MPIFHLRDDRIDAIPDTTFETAGIRERYDLQRLLRASIDVVAEDVMVLTEEFADWEDSKRRIDLLGLDKSANLVVFELKRSDDGGYMELQALRNAAMVASMTFEKALEVHEAFLPRIGQSYDARSAILEFLGWDQPDEDKFAQDVRVVLVAADFSRELTTSVLWLNEYGLDIRCVRIKPYADNGRVLLDVQQVLPLPEAEDYTIRIREKAERERDFRREQTSSQQLMKRFWPELLAKARGKSDLFSGISSPGSGTACGAGAGRSGIYFHYAFSRTNPRVELYIQCGDQALNKRHFDTLVSAKAAIENRLGQALRWDQKDDRQACRIAWELPEQHVRDQAKWPVLQDQMIDAMIKFERAMRPEIDRLER